MVNMTTKSSVDVARTGTHGLRSGRVRVGQEQRTHVMSRCWDTLDDLDMWCFNFHLFASVGVNNPEENRRNSPRGVSTFSTKDSSAGDILSFSHTFTMKSHSDGKIANLHDAPSSSYCSVSYHVSQGTPGASHTLAFVALHHPPLPDVKLSSAQSGRPGHDPVSS